MNSADALGVRGAANIYTPLVKMKLCRKCFTARWLDDDDDVVDKFSNVSELPEIPVDFVEDAATP
jgi:hypothetical protein